MAPHSSKKNALLHLINLISSDNVVAMEQLSDGRTFCNIISTVFPEEKFIPSTLGKENVKQEKQPIKQEKQKRSRRSTKEKQTILNAEKSSAEEIFCKNESKDESSIESKDESSIESKDDKPVCEDSKIKSEDGIKNDSKAVEKSIIEPVSIVNDSSGHAFKDAKLADGDIQSVTESHTSSYDSSKSAIELFKSSDSNSKSATEPLESSGGDSKSAFEPIKSADGKSKSAVEPIKSADGKSESAVEPIKSADGKSKSAIEPFKSADGSGSMSERYKFIEHFINERYDIQSTDFISYNSCQHSEELELAKVSAFIISEVIRHYVLTKHEIIETLLVLPAEIQHNLEQCFNFFITKRQNITKEKLCEILCHETPFKTPTPEKRICNITPRRSCSSKYRRTLDEFSSEENFVSPLRSYFESPIFKQKDMKAKDKEIQKITEDLFREEEKSQDLLLELDNVKKMMAKKEQEISKLKANMRMMEEEEKIYQNEAAEKLEKKKEALEKKTETLEKKKEALENKTETLEKKKEALENKTEKLEKKIEDLENKYKLLECHLLSKQTQLFGKKRQIEELVIKRNALLMFDDKIAHWHENEKISEENIKKLEAEIGNYKLMLKKFNINDGVEENPKSFVQGECIGKYVEGNTILKKPDEESFEIEDQKNEMKEHVEEQCLKENLNCPVKNDSGTLMPELIALNIPPEDEKFQNLKKKAKIEKEGYSDEQDACNISCNSDSTSKHTAESASVEVPSSENSNALTTNKHIGSLWSQHLGSNFENENNGKEDCSSMQNTCDPSYNSNVEPKNSTELAIVEVPSTEKSQILITNEGLGALWSQHKDGLSSENVDAIHHMIANFNKTLTIFERLQTEFLKKKEYILSALNAFSSKNGSNGFTGLQIVKNFQKDLESLQGCLEYSHKCIRVMFHNNNSPSEGTIMVSKTECNSDLTKCSRSLEQLREENETVNGTPDYTIDKERECKISVLKTELHDLQDRYQTVLKSQEKNLLESEEMKKTIKNLKSKNQCLKLKVVDYKKKEKKFEENKEEEFLRKEIELKYQKLDGEYKDAMKKESEHRKRSKKYLFSLQMRIEAMTDVNKKLKDEMHSLRNQNNELNLHIKHLEEKIERNVQVKASSAVNVTEEEELPKVKGTKDEYKLEDNTRNDFSKSEFISTNVNEVSSQNTGNESILTGALCSKSFQSGLTFPTYDEEGFINVSSIAEIHTDYGSTSAEMNLSLEELKRRNTMNPRELRTSYPVLNLDISENEIKNTSESIIFREYNNGTIGSKLKNVENIGRKRKAIEIETKSQPNTLLATPTAKVKRFKTPSSLQKFLQFRRSRRPDFIKPKP